MLQLNCAMSEYSTTTVVACGRECVITPFLHLQCCLCVTGRHYFCIVHPQRWRSTDTAQCSWRERKEHKNHF